MGWRNFLKNNTKLEKILILLIAVLCGAVLVLFSILLSRHDQETYYNPESIQAASHILDTVDATVDPCNDFYKFACGKFLKNAFSLEQPTMLHNLRIQMKNRLEEIVTGNKDRRNNSRGLQMQRKFYRTCINDTTIDRDNDRTLLNLLNNVTGGWPVVKAENWNGKNFNWINAMIEARKLGFFYQFYFRVKVFKRNDTANILWIRPINENDINTFYWTNENQPIMTQIASDLGGHNRNILKEIEYTITFAEQLNLVHGETLYTYTLFKWLLNLFQIVQEYYNNTKKNEEYDRRQSTIKHLKHRLIDINWLEFLKNLTGVDITDNDVVIFDVDKYFESLYYLLHKTHIKTQANFMAWIIISTNIQYMTKKVRQKHMKMRGIKGTESSSSRSDLCYTISRELFKHVAEGEYVRRYTSTSKRGYVGEMVKNIKHELELVLKETFWMDEETKYYALRHLKHITEEIGWTKLVYDAEKFESLFGYHKVETTSDKLVDMARLMNINEINRYYRQLRQTILVEEEEYVNTPNLDVNAFYLKYFDKLILPTPILQGIIIDERRPHYMNYGSLGSIIGHEFMHGLIEHSSSGEVDKYTWWTNRTIKNFKKISQCLINDYKRYPGKIGFKESSTVFEENVADFSGVNLAYTAYKKWSQRNKVGENLPGIGYTPDQLFWIMTSTYLCSEPRLLQDESKQLIHAVASYRVIGRLQNSPHFAKAFECPVGSPMNPKNKCRIFA